ncbi:MAG: cytochrome c peroxidase, partial [Campylobacter sp.]|nr:cytochrome c peroxidase [Campylobacter sp.]
MKKVLVLSAVLASALFAADTDEELLQAAKDVGLRALPATQAEVDALLKEIGVTPNKFTVEKAELGKKLYLEPRLSKSGIISCNTCHNLGLGGTDG